MVGKDRIVQSLKEKDLEREEREESTLSKAGGRQNERSAVDATTNEETDEKAPESGGEEQVDEEEEKEEEEEEGGSSNSFDINEELEAAISGKSRAEKMEEIEAEQKARLGKREPQEGAKRIRTQTNRGSIETPRGRKLRAGGGKVNQKEDLKEEIEEQPETAEEKDGHERYGEQHRG